MIAFVTVTSVFILVVHIAYWVCPNQPYTWFNTFIAVPYFLWTLLGIIFALSWQHPGKHLGITRDELGFVGAFEHGGYDINNELQVSFEGQE